MQIEEKQPILKKKQTPFCSWGFGDQDQEDHLDWEDLLNDVDYLLETKTSTGYYYVEVKNFGWRNLSGHKYVKAKNAEELLKKILPDTDCNFKIFEEASNSEFQLRLQNFHHDSPMGDENYYIKFVAAHDYEENA